MFEMKQSIAASSSTKQTETEADGNDCGGSEPARSSNPDRHLQPDSDLIY